MSGNSGPVEYRINFRIKPSDNLTDELDRLARIISRKYKKEIRIYVKEWRNGK